MRKAEFYAEALEDCPGPLEGVRVLEATNYGPGPMCGMVLADYGAESIKVEMPGSGDPARQLPPFVEPGAAPEASCWHQSLNRGKKSITLDIRTPKGQQLFRKLAAQSDIVIESFTPGTMDKWNLGYRDLLAVKTDIIYVSISAFGQFGPLHTRKGFDPIAQAMGGMMNMTGERGGRPLRSGFAIVDNMCAWQGAMAAIAALHYRRASGRGQHIDAALADVTLYCSDIGLMGEANANYRAKRLGNATDAGAPLNTYRCGDGRYLFINAAVDSHWARLCELMDRPELATDPDYAGFGARARNLDAVDAAVGAWAASLTLDEALTRLDETGVTAGPVMDFDEIMNGVSPKFSLTPGRIRSAAAALGEDNDEVWGQLRLSGEEQAALHDDGVI